ncbi:cytochrome P450 [Mycena haematopus]|nr:cytochrome P450 [Mycena haematopus]
MNLAASDGLVWRKHRRVVGPAFGPDLYKLVWKKTAETYRDILEMEGWKDKEVVDIPVMQKITFKLAFLIICTCGFGFPAVWLLTAAWRYRRRSRLSPRPSYSLLSSRSGSCTIPRLRAARVSRERLRAFMQEQVVERKALVAAGDTRADAFTMLVKANQDESSHETTAHTFAATLGFMAVHEEIQEEVFEQIISVVGCNRVPTFDILQTGQSPCDVLRGFTHVSRWPHPHSRGGGRHGSDPSECRWTRGPQDRPYLEGHTGYAGYGRRPIQSPLF